MARSSTVWWPSSDLAARTWPPRFRLMVTGGMLRRPPARLGDSPGHDLIERVAGCLFGVEPPAKGTLGPVQATVEHLGASGQDEPLEQQLEIADHHGCRVPPVQLTVSTTMSSTHATNSSSGAHRLAPLPTSPRRPGSGGVMLMTRARGRGRS